MQLTNAFGFTAGHPPLEFGFLPPSAGTRPVEQPPTALQEQLQWLEPLHGDLGLQK